MATIVQSTTKIPGSKANIPFLSKYINIVHFMQDCIEFVENLPDDWGDVFSPMLSAPQHEADMVMALGPEYNRQVLANPDTFFVPDLLGKNQGDSNIFMLTQGLPFINDDLHKEQRRLLMPAFHKQHIQNYRQDMIEQASRVVDSWQPGQAINLNGEMTRITMYVVMKTLFGIVAGQKEEQLAQSILSWLDEAAHPLHRLIGYIDFPGSPYRKLRETSAALAKVFEDIIANKRQHPEGTDIMAALLAIRDDNEQPLTNSQIIGHANTLFLAGYETTSNSLTWTLFLLNQHPQVMRDLMDEFDSVLGGAVPTLEQLNQLPLLDGVIKESIRLFPALVYMLRQAQDDFQFGAYHLKRGTTVMISQYYTHRMAELYADPYRFNPYRWQDINPSPYEYFTFSAGARRCAGAEFATMEMKLVLPLILQRFRLEPSPDTTVNYKLNVSLLQTGIDKPFIVHKQDRQFRKVPVGGTVHRMVNLG
jgi:cytochrome P450